MELRSYFRLPRNKGTQEGMAGDPRWEGIPPVGNRAIDDRWKFLSLILMVFVVKIAVWSVYRWVTGNLYPFTDPRVGSEWNYAVSTFAKPLLQLGPVFFLWWYLFKEKGLPFKLTKKNLTSSVIWGCLGGVLFYVVASLVFVGHMSLTGKGQDFSLVAGWNVEGVGWSLVIATLFSYMLSTGPAEELFSRGFLQDQTARGFSLGAAIIFSSVLFAIGHLPISIMVHHLSFEAIMWYMLTLVIMGAFFSLIYQWSRNIVLPIIIHGLWDWYLTLFQIKGSYAQGIIADPQGAFGAIDLVNTVITLAIMLPFFYLLHRYFWREDAKEKRSGVIRWIRRMDTGERFKNSRQPWLMAVGVTFVFCILMLPTAALFSTSDPAKMKDRPIEAVYVPSFSNFTFEETGTAREGEPLEFPVKPESGSVVSVNVSVTWEDEPPESGIIRDYENKPDRFRLTIKDPEGAELAVKESSDGYVFLTWSTAPDKAVNGSYTISLELVNAGDQEPPNQFLQPVEDDSNEYILKGEYKSVTFEKADEDDYHIRW